MPNFASSDYYLIGVSVKRGAACVTTVNSIAVLGIELSDHASPTIGIFLTASENIAALSGQLQLDLTAQTIARKTKWITAVPPPLRRSMITLFAKG